MIPYTFPTAQVNRLHRGVLNDGSENQPEFRGKLLNQNSTVGILNYVNDASE